MIETPKTLFGSLQYYLFSKVEKQLKLLVWKANFPPLSTGKIKKRIIKEIMY